jgi:hypothetical protein
MAIELAEPESLGERMEQAHNAPRLNAAQRQQIETLLDDPITLIMVSEMHPSFLVRSLANRLIEAKGREKPCNRLFGRCR